MHDNYAKIFANFTGEEAQIIPLLQAIQTEYGFLSKDAILAVAQFTKVPEAKVFGVATFYAQFRFNPPGKKRIVVCRGTACHVKGAPQILEKLETELEIKVGQTTKDGEYSLETVACIGCCGLAPCAVIDDKVEANLTPKSVEKLFTGGK